MTAAAEGGWDFDEFLDEFRPPEQPVSVTTRGDLIGELHRLEGELAAAQDAAAGEGIDDPSGALDIASKIMDLRERVRASERTFTVRSIGEQAWSDLVADHPPTKDDRERRLPWHPATFWPAAIAASCIQPKLTVEQVGKMLTRLSSGQMSKLTGAVLAVNGGGDDIPKSDAGFVLRRGSKRSSNTASL